MDQKWEDGYRIFKVNSSQKWFQIILFSKYSYFIFLIKKLHPSQFRYQFKQVHYFWNIPVVLRTLSLGKLKRIDFLVISLPPPNLIVLSTLATTESIPCFRGLTQWVEILIEVAFKWFYILTCRSSPPPWNFGGHKREQIEKKTILCDDYLHHWRLASSHLESLLMTCDCINTHISVKFLQKKPK